MNISSAERLTRSGSASTSRATTERRDARDEHAGHGFWAMVACCLPMIVLFVLVALKVI